MLRSRFLGSGLLTLWLSACAHGVVSELPTSPTTSVTIKNITVTPTGGGTLIAGVNQAITTDGTTLGLGAWATFSDGSSKYVDATWTSSDTNVIAFDGAMMKAIGRGSATVTARVGGMSDSETFTVAPNMAGTWSGSYVVDQCAAGSGSMQELICNADPARKGVLPVGTVAPMTFVIDKNGNDLTATTALGEIRGTLRGTDLGSNYLFLKGDLTVNRTTITVVQWNARVVMDAMEGQLGFEVRIEGIPSHAIVIAHLDQVTRR